MEVHQPLNAPTVTANHEKTTTATYCKVPLEGLGSSVSVVSTDLTVVVDVQPVQFIEPVWNWLQEWQTHTVTAGDQVDNNETCYLKVAVTLKWERVLWGIYQRHVTAVQAACGSTRLALTHADFTHACYWGRNGYSVQVCLQLYLAVPAQW